MFSSSFLSLKNLLRLTWRYSYILMEALSASFTYSLKRGKRKKGNTETLEVCMSTQKESESEKDLSGCVLRHNSAESMTQQT